MFQPILIQPGDLTSTVVSRFNDLSEALAKGSFTYQSPLIDATQAQDLVLVNAIGNHHLYIRQIRIMVWDQEPDANVFTPQFSVGTNALANNVQANTAIGNTIKQMQVWTPSNSVVNIDALPLRLRLITSNYPTFQIRFWVEGALIED
jgi:hypothetical protein